MEENLMKKFIDKLEENDFEDEIKDEFTVDLCNLQDVYNELNLLDQLIEYLTFIKNNGLPDLDSNMFTLNYYDKEKFLYIHDENQDVDYVIKNNRWKMFSEWDDLVEYFKKKNHF